MKRTSFCNNWEFSRDGAAFEPVVVPHDAMLGARRDADAPAGSASGYFYGGRYRYRKSFRLNANQAGGHILLEFEGVYRDAHICVNGTPVEAPPYGFVPFFIDLTGLVHPGDNVVEVDADNAGQPDCRWYSGAGIYRPVWLWEGGPAHITPEGVRVTTLSIDPAAIRVDIDHVKGVPLIRVLDENDNEVARGRGTSTTLAIPQAHMWSADTPYRYRCVVDLVDESSCETGPVEPPIVDTAEAWFGIRLLSWSAEGFFVNGRETLLRGGCIHCDNGIIGAASFAESEWRRVRLLKDAGFNALRIAHNPAPTALLEACDALGMYVMDEAWDMWFTPKSAHDYSSHFLDWLDYDLKRLANRDYNHPSVIMYSIGNEVADPLSDAGVQVEQAMVALLHSLDPTRPVTCGLNLTMMVMERIGQGWYDDADGVAAAASDEGAPHGSLLFNLMAQASGTGMTLLANAPGADGLVSPALDALDIAGYNYAAARYPVDARKHPGRIIVGTETFPYELSRNWRAVKRIPCVIGDFMWAAWDYLGEAGAGAWAYTAEEAGFSKPWPWLLAGSGALDIMGNPNAHAALAGAVWGACEKPSIQVRPVNRMNGRTYRATWRGSDAVPSWSWRSCEGIRTHVEVYDARAFSIRLELNGKTVGQKRMRNHVARFTVPYQTGVCTAIALDSHGQEVARSHLASATGPLHLQAQVETPYSTRLDNRNETVAPGIAYVDLSIQGLNGIVESNADEQLTATVDNGTLLGFGSPQPAPTQRYDTGTFTTYRGHAQAIVHRETPGTATLTVCGTNLKSVSVPIYFA